uniref:DnaJ homolog subfamily C member 21 n=1 Tax=Glossina brevipalpis TaxID=37001 RepID=A0A1A9X3T5_9MUSC
MKCYYEELGVERDANESEIKTAYRKLALKWHPDKNLDCLDSAKERFQLIQQAYDVLSDPQERAWYDNHREQILRGKNSDYEDNSLDVFQYFSGSCFKGYGDDDNGFYAVYRNVFQQIAVEDAEFMDDEMEMEKIPSFGDSQSSYDEIVGTFYAYWSAYCTKKTYVWLCPYDIKSIKDRRILREIEKDMKKVVQKAKKERNEEVRNLVAFVRKRDKRVLAYRRLLEERAAFNRQKQEQNRLEQIRRRQEKLEEVRLSRIAQKDDDYEEQLKQLEQQYSDEEYDEEDLESDSEEVEQCSLNGEIIVEEDNLDDCLNDLYCVACNRSFKNENAFANHEMSKKHKENLGKLKTEMQNEEILYQNNESKEDEETQQTDIHSETPNRSRKSKKDSKKSKTSMVMTADQDEEESNLETEELGKTFENSENEKDNDESWSNTNKKGNKKSKNKQKVPKIQTIKQTTISSCSNSVVTKSDGKETDHSNNLANNENPEKTLHICATCEANFESKNKLFIHLKLTNHSVYLPKPKVSKEETDKTKKPKGKRSFVLKHFESTLLQKTLQSYPLKIATIMIIVVVTHVSFN